MIALRALRHALTLPDGQEQVLPVGRELDLRAELAALALRHLMPQHLEPFEARLVAGDLELGAREREARAAFAGLGIGEVDVMGGPVARRREYAERAALSAIEYRGCVRDLGLLAPLRHQPHRADLFRDQHAPVGQERDAPRKIQRRHLRHREPQIAFGLLLAGVDLRMGRNTDERAQQNGEYLHRNSSLRSSSGKGMRSDARGASMALRTGHSAELGVGVVRAQVRHYESYGRL